MGKRVIVVGGGIAGMQTALKLSAGGVSALLLECDADLGGKLTGWHKLFPSFTPAHEVLDELRRRLAASDVEVRTRCEVAEVARDGVTLSTGERLEADAVVVATGFTLFDARIKEEYGYGIYDNVYTTVDIERMLNEGRVALKDGTAPRRIAFLHCVGSRDEKVCQHHCSKVCCITGVKQAMELKEMFPAADVFNFYMDIRMFGPGYEEMYRDAQQRLNIHFVRGRISEASPTLDGRVQIKAEDTLTGRPLKMSVDMLVLIVGMRSNASNARFAAGAGLGVQPSGFLAPRDAFLHNVESGVDGIFYAGAVTAPKNIGESLSEAVVAADRAAARREGRTWYFESREAWRTVLKLALALTAIAMAWLIDRCVLGFTRLDTARLFAGFICGVEMWSFLENAAQLSDAPLFRRLRRYARRRIGKEAGR